MKSVDDHARVEALVAEILQKMRDKGCHIATAESCTGGLVAAALTAVAGSSDVVMGGVVAYANGAKESLLGVSPALLAQHGAVSAQVAEAMAMGAAKRLGATHAVSLTGIAGPTGGTAGKPVGTVFCGIVSPAGVRHCHWLFVGDRQAVREQSVLGALHELKREVER
jgi:PncC family amidohydrolase